MPKVHSLAVLHAKITSLPESQGPNSRSGSPSDSGYGSEPRPASYTSQESLFPLVNPASTHSVGNPSLPFFPATSEHLKTQCSEFNPSFVVLVKDGHITRWPANLKDIDSHTIATTCQALTSALTSGNDNDGYGIHQHAQHFLKTVEKNALTLKLKKKEKKLLCTLKSLLATKQLSAPPPQKDERMGQNSYSNTSTDIITPEERQAQFGPNIKALKTIYQAGKFQYLKDHFPQQCSFENIEKLSYNESEVQSLCFLNPKASDAVNLSETTQHAIQTIAQKLNAIENAASHRS